MLEKGVISPSSKREELLLLAKEYGLEASKSVTSAWSASTGAVGQATDAVVDNASSAFYSVIDAPVQAYDYVADSLQSKSLESFSSIL